MDDAEFGCDSGAAACWPANKWRVLAESSAPAQLDRLGGGRAEADVASGRWSIAAAEADTDCSVDCMVHPCNQVGSSRGKIVEIVCLKGVS